jgi:CPA2 family monovalent cation:H+ antiporter-2
MPEEARNLILAGALVSIALNPILFRLTRDWAIRRGLTQERMSDDTLAHLETEEKIALKNLIVLIGSSNTGRHIINAIDTTQNDLVILDENREKVEKLRSRGFHAVAGNATESDVLIEAGIDKAYAVMITVPDPFESLRIVELIETINPSARVFVQSRNDDETELFDSKMVEKAVSATEEVARRMVGALKG